MGVDRLTMNGEFPLEGGDQILVIASPMDVLFSFVFMAYLFLQLGLSIPCICKYMKCLLH